MNRRRASFPVLLALLAGLPAVARAEVRSVRLVREGADFAAAPLDPALSLREGSLRASREAVWASPVLDAGLAFSAIGLHWSGAPDAGIELGVSPDGIRWSRWIAVPREGAIEETREDGRPSPFAGESVGALAFVAPGSRFVRCRVRLHATAAGAPGLRRIALHVIDPGPPVPAARSALEGPASVTGARAARAGDAARGVRAKVPPPEEPEPGPRVRKPPIVSRSAWGARPPKYAYGYTLAGHLGVHHTATVEDFTAETFDECAARMRAIQTYHMDTNGWNDVGYGYAICRHGDVFQAREDDDDATDVQGAHDGFNRGSTGITVFGYFHPPVDQRPTDAQVSSLVDLVAWVAGLRGFDPLGRSLYEAFGSPVDNVYGHREVKATDCPGDHLFALKETVRRSASDRMLTTFW